MKHHGFQRWFSLVCNCSRVVNHKDKQELRPLWFRLKFSNSVKLIFSCFRLLLLKNSLLLLLSLFYIPGNVIYKYSLKDTHGLNTHVSTTELQKWVTYQRRPLFALPDSIPLSPSQGTAIPIYVVIILLPFLIVLTHVHVFLGNSLLSFVYFCILPILWFLKYIVFSDFFHNLCMSCASFIVINAEYPTI